MNNPTRVRCSQLHPVLSVSDVQETVAFYVDQLGFDEGFLWGDPPSIAGLNLDQVSLHVAQGTPTPTGCSVYFVVDDVDAIYERAQASAATIVYPVEEQEYGLRDFCVADNNGYHLHFGEHSRGAEEPLKIEREALDLRLEKRLLAVVRDLAASKGMDVNQMLEETLLHTFEPAPGGGVASPHTAATLKLIEQLKQKHGIDYDTHASYRFTE